MSAADAEAKRKAALDALRMKKLGTTDPRYAGHRGQTSPPSSSSSVLVPPSSSPAQPTTNGHFMNGSTSSHRSSNIIPSSRLSVQKPYDSMSHSSMTLSPSMNRPTASLLGTTPTSTVTPGPAGSPAAAMQAILNRRKAEDEPREAGPSSLSYEPSRSANSPSSPGTPDTPPQRSRLKPRYDESPTTPRTSQTPRNRTPSLILAAKQSNMGEYEVVIRRLCNQFRETSPVVIADIVRRHKGNIDRAIHEISTGAPRVTTPELPAFKQSDIRPLPPAPVTLYPTPTAHKSPKPRKNERSTIYANREIGHSTIPEKHKRRDLGSESEADGAGSEAESEMSWSGDEGRRKRPRVDDDVDAEGGALEAFNENTVDLLTGTIACSVDQANTIIKLRPYEDIDDVRTKLTKARGVSFKLFEQYTEIMEGYVQIDACLNKCEGIANDVANALSIWRGASLANDSVIGTPRSDGLNDVKVDIGKVSEMLRQETDVKRRKILNMYVQNQPPSLRAGTVLKDYQLLGVNWLNLLFSKKIGCILADEMGLGKTIQVIAFIAHLKERGIKGTHMIFVPASTLENWTREFERFAPGVDVQTYYGSQAERVELRNTIKRLFRSGRLEVVLASYTQVTSHDDLSFFRKKIEFDTCIYDEGHKLKSCTTKAYADLLSIRPRWRLLLTGTPLQNNLQELVSLLMFIHKDVFADAEPYLRAIFKSQGHANLLSQQRVSRARTMLTPFVLRRRKAQVLSLPPKTERVEHCEMTVVQAKLYRETLQRSKKVLGEMTDEALADVAAADEEDVQKKSKIVADGNQPKNGKKSVVSSSSHILMDLRKAASHPLLFRRLFTNAKIRQIAKTCLSTPRWAESVYEYVVEDLEVMSDAEISHFCAEAEYEELRKFALKPTAYLEGGKVQALVRHIERCKADSKRMLLFSQFVMILDILEVALDHLDIRFTRLDGSSRTDERQGLVDEFNEDSEITVFLLSTKAGGVGINLTAASVVIIFDQDFNPHNDRQAADRAYRIGQEKEVEVIKLITKDSIDEDMLAIGQTKLKLDDAVGGEEIALGDADGSKDDQTAKEVRTSLITSLRNKFDHVAQPLDTSAGSVEEESTGPTAMDESPRKKIARGGVENASSSTVV